MLKFVIGAAILATATPVLAQSADDSSWTGFYAGGRMGYSFQPGDGDERFKFDTNNDRNFNDIVRTTAGVDAFSPGFCGGGAKGPTPATGCQSDRDSLEFALHAGFDYDFGGIVVGVVGEGGIGYAEDSVSAFSTTPAFYTLTRRMKENASIRARAGYALGASRNTLVYGTGGVVWAHMARNYTTSNTANTGVRQGDDGVFGYRVGGGVEQRVHPHLSIGLQYLFTSLKDNDQRVFIGAGSAPATNPFRLVNSGGTMAGRTHSRFAAHNISLTANYRF